MSSKKKNIPPPLPMPATGVETHAHLSREWYSDEELPQVIARARQAGLCRIAHVFLSPESCQAEIRRFDPYPELFFLLGIHPTEAFLYSPATEQKIIDCLQTEPKIRCIGEIGLDYYWKEVQPDLQKKVFKAQLRLAQERNYPVSIHCREATEDTISILLEEGFRGRPLLWHCFGGDTHLALRLVEYGWHLSIPGIVTYPANAQLRQAVGAIPDDRIVMETDCPFLSPVPMRGKRNEPSYLPYTIKIMAQARNTTPEALWTLCGDNAKRFFQVS